MKTKNLSMLIQADDNQVYQVALAKDHEAYVLDLLEQPLEGVLLT